MKRARSKSTVDRGTADAGGEQLRATDTARLIGRDTANCLGSPSVFRW
jgi:hypothetical protein